MQSYHIDRFFLTLSGAQRVRGIHSWACDVALSRYRRLWYLWMSGNWRTCCAKLRICLQHLVNPTWSLNPLKSFKLVPRKIQLTRNRKAIIIRPISYVILDQPRKFDMRRYWESVVFTIQTASSEYSHLILHIINGCSGLRWSLRLLREVDVRGTQTAPQNWCPTSAPRHDLSSDIIVLPGLSVIVWSP